MSIIKAFELIEKSINNSDFCGSIESDKIELGERILGIKFPKSYSIFLRKFGAGDIAGIELFGIIKDPMFDGNMIPNSIWLTQNLREELSLPRKFLVIAETGFGPYYVLDTGQKDDDFESPVYIWDKGNQMEKVADSYGIFLFNLLEESI